MYMYNEDFYHIENFWMMMNILKIVVIILDVIGINFIYFSTIMHLHRRITVNSMLKYYSTNLDQFLSSLVATFEAFNTIPIIFSIPVTFSNQCIGIP